MKKIMIFNLKYLILPLSIVVCINNNGKCMYFPNVQNNENMMQQMLNMYTNMQYYNNNNQYATINKLKVQISNGNHVYIYDDGIEFMDFVQIIESFKTENAENLSEGSKYFIQKLAENVIKPDCDKFRNGYLNDAMFQKLRNRKLTWNQVFSYLYEGALVIHDNNTLKFIHDYPTCYLNFIKSIETCYKKNIITKQQYQKLLDNLLHHNLTKHFNEYLSYENNSIENMLDYFFIDDNYNKKWHNGKYNKFSNNMQLIVNNLARLLCPSDNEEYIDYLSNICEYFKQTVENVIKNLLTYKTSSVNITNRINQKLNSPDLFNKMITTFGINHKLEEILDKKEDLLGKEQYKSLLENLLNDYISRSIQCINNNDLSIIFDKLRETVPTDFQTDHCTNEAIKHNTLINIIICRIIKLLINDFIENNYNNNKIRKKAMNLASDLFTKWRIYNTNNENYNTFDQFQPAKRGTIVYHVLRLNIFNNLKEIIQEPNIPDGLREAYTDLIASNVYL